MTFNSNGKYKETIQKYESIFKYKFKYNSDIISSSGNNIFSETNIHLKMYSNHIFHVNTQILDLLPSRYYFKKWDSESRNQLDQRLKKRSNFTWLSY